MNRTALITGADRGLGFGMTKKLVEEGWTVYAGTYLKEWPELNGLAGLYPEQCHPVDLDVASDESVQQAFEEMSGQHAGLDLLINNAGVSTPYKDKRITEEQDYDDLIRLYNVNAVGPFRVLHTFLPMMTGMKRLCFVSSEAGSVSSNQRTVWHGYCMSKAALNRGVHESFNRLRPLGYTFRLYHPGWVRSYMSGQLGDQYELEIDDAARFALDYFVSNRCSAEEDTLAMKDWLGRDWPW